MATGPRIYNLFPTLAGPIRAAGKRDWYAHLERIAAMGFNWLYVNPFHLSGFSGSLYAVKDFYALHPRVVGNSRTKPDRLVKDFVAEAGKHRIGFMMDLVINHTSKDALLTEQHPEWYVRESDGSLYSPRAIDPADASNVTVWGDLAELNYAEPESRRGLVGYWEKYIAHQISLGVTGFRCDAAYQVPSEVWAELIAGARKLGEVQFFAETLGATLEQIRSLEQAGFDYFFNSSKWWDFEAGWLLEQYETFRHIAPSIAFPESHDTPRLVQELGDSDPDMVRRHYQQRYLFAATFSAGVMMPMGYEFGFSKPLHVVETTADDWESPLFDLSDFIGRVNRLKAAVPALNVEGPQRRLATDDGKLLLLFRESDRPGENSHVLSAFNVSTTKTLNLSPYEVLTQLDSPAQGFRDVTPGAAARALTGGSMLPLSPLESRIFEGGEKVKPKSGKTTAPVKEDKTLRAAPSRDEISAIVRSEHSDVFSVLGMHKHEDGKTLVVRAFLPGATSVSAIDAKGAPIARLERFHREGFFAGVVEGHTEPVAYRLKIEDEGGERVEDDPYRFPSMLGDTDLYLLGEGTHRRAYERLGAHLKEFDGVQGVNFVVWAPNARRVSVVGDFNGWDGRRHVMRKHPSVGLWDMFIPGIGEGALYKFEVKGPYGELLPLKADPYALRMQHPPENASVVADLSGYRWSDSSWMQQRASTVDRDAPMSIYEVHLGSWRRVVEEGNRYLSYRELADSLIPYVKEMGFTHIQTMPVSEFPFDGSWGYQPIGLFAPTSRFGKPSDFKYFVDRCHQEGIGLLIDWVPGHFPTDAHGLGFFDGSHLFEHADPRQGFHQDWNTLIYNYGRNEVVNFLLSNGLFWLDEYHVDGLRVDAVASMLYLDYSRKEGEWIPNKYGGRENLEAIEFLRKMNEMAYGDYPGIATIAEESTAWPGVSKPVYLGGLGFGYKWNMGWMHDTLEYIQRDPVYRRYHHHEMTFGLLYAFSENFVLPLSHDEVVHGKGSLLDRMPGDTWQKFANLRAYFGFMWTHPGKKLLFMGGEFGQGAEWNFDGSLDWHLLDVEWHKGVQNLIRDLNHLYVNTPALHQKDCEPEGFEWVEANDYERSIYAFMRYGEAGTPPVLVVCNFTPMKYPGVRFGVPSAGFYAERLNSDSKLYGGSNVGNAGGAATEAVGWQGQPHSIVVTVPPLSTVVFELQG